MLSGVFEAIHHIVFNYYKDDIVVFALESDTKNFRNDIYGDYKQIEVKPR